MNMSPQQVDAMSIWQFFAMVEGITAGSDNNSLSETEKDELWQLMQESS